MNPSFLQNFSRPLLFAHRGYSAKAPENTMAAFRLAWESGIPGIELDVHLCKSGEAVVFRFLWGCLGFGLFIGIVLLGGGFCCVGLSGSGLWGCFRFVCFCCLLIQT